MPRTALSDVSANHDVDHRIVEQLARVVCWTAQGWLLLTAVVLVLCRLADRFAPLSGIAFVLIVSALVAIWFLLRWPAMQRRQGAWALIAGSIALLLSLLVLTIPGTPLVALVLGWLVFLLVEGFVWAEALERLPQHVADRPALFVEERAGDELAGEATADEEIADDEAVPTNLLQQLTRMQLDDGSLAIEGLLRCQFTAGDALCVVHVPFGPPLAIAPQVEADLIEGPEASVRVTLAETFGARLEIRRSPPLDEPAEAVVRLYAQAAATSPTV